MKFLQFVLAMKDMFQNQLPRGVLEMQEECKVHT